MVLEENVVGFFTFLALVAYEIVVLRVFIKLLVFDSLAILILLNQAFDSLPFVIDLFQGYLGQILMPWTDFTGLQL